MRKIITLLSIVFCLNANAQYVIIPDANFVTYLQGLIPAAMSGNQMDTSSTLVTTTTHSISITNSHIANLSGIQYFTSLTWLDCEHDSLTNLPTLPTALISLWCGYNHLTSLPALPNSLTDLGCSQNHLTNLPALPNAFIDLDCSSNQLTSLPTLPNSVSYLHCSSNQLTSLPTLPNSLSYLDCSSNQLTSLPTLPNSLKKLNCSNNFLTNLNLPNIDSTLLYIDCSTNQLTSLQALPNSLQTLWCYNNNISCFPTFPNSISGPYLNSYGQIVYNIYLNGNPFTCLPNYLTYVMPSSLLAYPLCAAGNANGCAVATGIEQISFNNYQVLVYPNPTSGQFIVETNSDKLTVDLFDINGGHVFNANVSNKSNINVAFLNEGVYTLTIKTADRVINKKLVIVH